MIRGEQSVAHLVGLQAKLTGEAGEGVEPVFPMTRQNGKSQ